MRTIFWAMRASDPLGFGHDCPVDAPDVVNAGMDPEVGDVGVICHGGLLSSSPADGGLACGLRLVTGRGVCRGRPHQLHVSPADAAAVVSASTSTSGEP
jgi:hypothetical protein